MLPLQWLYPIVTLYKYLQIFLFIFPAVWTFLKDLKVNNHQIVGILSQTGKKNLKTFIYIHSRLPEKVSASSIFWNRLKLNTSIVGLVAEFIGCSVLWFIASLIVKLCVHFVSVCLKVQKWTPTETKVPKLKFGVKWNVWQK